jgi:hypothetical protein
MQRTNFAMNSLARGVFDALEFVKLYVAHNRELRTFSSLFFLTCVSKFSKMDLNKSDSEAMIPFATRMSSERWNSHKLTSNLSKIFKTSKSVFSSAMKF